MNSINQRGTKLPRTAKQISNISFPLKILMASTTKVNPLSEKSSFKYILLISTTASPEHFLRKKATFRGRRGIMSPKSVMPLTHLCEFNSSYYTRVTVTPLSVLLL